jgi:hypothetical protein
MPLPPAFEDRSPVEQIVGAVVVTMVFGIVCGLALGWNEIVYYILVGPVALAGGFFGGMEHRTVDEGIVRGALGGLVFGSFVLLGLEILNTDPKAYLGDPQSGLVFVTTIVGSILGALGAAYRARREREQLGASAPPASSR